MITIEHLHYQLAGGTPILKDITTHIPKGGITALVGPNGAGKSTLFAHIARLQTIQQGKILIDQLDVSKTPIDEMAKKIAILRQDNTVNSRITVERMLMFGRYPYHKGRPRTEDVEIVNATLEQFQLVDLRERFMTELSGGQRQRVMVAMVFCQSTDYLLLDEPLNNLDMYHSRQLMQQLRHIADTYQRTIVVVLHDINYASAYADYIIGMKSGEVILEGKPTAVLTEHNLERLFGVNVPIVMINGYPMVMHYL
ncbi:ATP-binding cassette domain-containing protein [Pelistega sp. NLN82]|uniref:ATP-binding cassette domain-containing protein n=1 Tax=Pelistega ratti TaxID=2652177 RepID=A0A6L9Y7Z6_9BURK|nr:ATP-binding cassette domain-containing protein [Pelistega ratti]NEN75938.1 ATP-binding cassette domain-containing protein [Pelistega ratti]